MNKTLATRNKEKREADRVKIAQLLVQGVSITKISELLDIPYNTVSYDVARIREKWLQSQLFDFNAARQMELLKIDQVESEAWRSWLKSLRPRGTALVGEVPETEEYEGHNQWLTIVLQCIDRRIKLLGLDAPIKIDVQTRLREAAIEMGLNPTDVLAEAERVLEFAQYGK